MSDEKCNNVYKKDGTVYRRSTNEVWRRVHLPGDGEEGAVKSPSEGQQPAAGEHAVSGDGEREHVGSLNSSDDSVEGISGRGGLVGLSCVNCKKEIAEHAAQFFSKVLVCEDCHLLAERMQVRGERSIQLLKALLTTSIQQAILDGRLQFHARALDKDPGVDFLGEIAKMVKQVQGSLAEEQGCLLSPTSAAWRESTKPRVSIVDGRPRSG